MLQELLYKAGLIGRPFGSKLGEKEPTKQEKMQALLILGLLNVQYPIEGPDVSRWQAKIDWGKFESELYFAYIQSSYGAAGIDSGFSINLAAAQKRNIAFGLYHYLKPGNDWRKTAQLFYDCWKDSGSQLPPAFDIEQNDGLDKNALNNWMEKVLNKFNELAGYDVPKVAYSSASFVNTYIMVTKDFGWVKALAWWIANWTTAAEPLLPKVFSLYDPKKDWDWWQYTSKGNGPKYGMGSPNVDLNRSHCSTLAEFNTKYHVNLLVRPSTPPPLPSGTPLSKLMVSTPAGVNVRSGPGISYPVVDTLPYKLVVTPLNIDGSNAWIQIAPDKWVCVTININGQHLRFLEKSS